MGSDPKKAMKRNRNRRITLAKTEKKAHPPKLGKRGKRREMGGMKVREKKRHPSPEKKPVAVRGKRKVNHRRSQKIKKAQWAPGREDNKFQGGTAN